MQRCATDKKRLPSCGTLTYHKSPSEMTPEEGVIWVKNLRERPMRKKELERAYLDRRQARGTHTPTDEAYEADQLLETELIDLLDVLAQRLAQEA